MQAIKLLLFDVDGVLTDGTILVHADGGESKAFNIRDGAGMVWAQRAGLTIGLLSARTAEATAARAVQLGITIVSQGNADKLAAYEKILADNGLLDEQVGYMGDDLQDLPVLRRAGFSAAPADAAPEVREAVQWVSPSGGGHGAARECIEHVLRVQGHWRAAVAAFFES
jgi:3-deoxy-D-manno-octulosonate 8-phosphate phosphatase (KDO 8-P phosphatase)